MPFAEAISETTDFCSAESKMTGKAEKYLSALARGRGDVQEDW
jgi:hypothetical protein